MALEGVLSLLRQVILDHPTGLPEGIDERRALYQQLQTNLSADELEDCAKIPPQRIALYSGTIFRGEANVIAKHYPVSIAVLKQSLEDEFSLYDLVCRTHRCAPWKSTQTLDLLASFRRFVCAELEVPKYLKELMRLEESVLELRRRPSAQEVFKAVSLEELRDFSLNQLLSAQFSANEVKTIHTFEHDVYAVMRSYFRDAKAWSVKEVSTRDNTLVGVRTAANRIKWLEVSAALGEVLFVDAQELRPVEQLAQAVLAPISERSELEQAEEFAKQVTQLAANELIYLFAE